MVVVVGALAVTGVIESSRVEEGWGVAERLRWWWVVCAVADKAVRTTRRVIGRPKSDVVAGLEGLLDKAGSLHATQRQYFIAFSLSLRNWGADCMCLVASIKAAGRPCPGTASCLFTASA